MAEGQGKASNCRKLPASGKPLRGKQYSVDGKKQTANNHRPTAKPEESNKVKATTSRDYAIMVFYFIHLQY